MDDHRNDLSISKSHVSQSLANSLQIGGLCTLYVKTNKQYSGGSILK